MAILAFAYLSSNFSALTPLCRSPMTFVRRTLFFVLLLTFLYRTTNNTHPHSPLNAARELCVQRFGGPRGQNGTIPFGVEANSGTRLAWGTSYTQPYCPQATKR